MDYTKDFPNDLSEPTLEARWKVLRERANKIGLDVSLFALHKQVPDGDLRWYCLKFVEAGTADDAVRIIEQELTFWEENPEALRSVE